MKLLNMPSRKKQTLALHIIACTLVILMPIIDAPSPNPKKILLFDNPYLEIDFLLHFLCLVFGYLNYFFLIPRFFHKPYTLVYAGIVLVFFLFICSVPWFISDIGLVNIFQEQEDINIHFVIQIRHAFFLFVAVFLFSLMTWSEFRRRKVERAVSSADLRYLKAQINPHFLFNSLNSIYVQLQTNHITAGESLVKMSNIMRYIMQSSDKQSESLGLAIAYLDDFLSLQKDRFLNTVEVVYNKNIEPNSYQIAPLLLIPFVENAFKYGINPKERAIITINISLVENVLTFEVINHDYSAEIVVPNSTSIGISNTQKRLKLIYPNKHSLYLTKKDGMFQALLVIQLK